MGEVLIKVEGVSKKFAKDLKKSLLYGLSDVFSGISRRTQDKSLRKDEFWAVKDISFEVRRGECLGLIGHNGAGKSTLLKILNGLIAPDEGSVTMYGKVGALIELGAGFNPILTGRENIYNNAAIIGFTRQEIEAKFNDIVAFAEIEEFIDMPVQNYSSGMKVRLGFAIAAQMEPDILIIDEVLAVGDVGFRAKCYERISELMKKCCVILVTHSMPQVSKICTESILLHKGKVKFKGNNGEVIEAYYDDNFVSNNVNVIYDRFLKLKDFNLENNQIANFYKDFKISIVLDNEMETINAVLDVVLMSRELVPVAQLNSKIIGKEITIHKGLNQIEVLIDDVGLNIGLYKLSFNVSDFYTGEQYLWIQNITTLKVTGGYLGHCPVVLKGSFVNSY